LDADGFDADGRIAHALAGRIEDGVGNRGNPADERDLAAALDAEPGPEILSH